MRWVWGLCALLLAASSEAQPGCRTVVLPELTNTPNEIATRITVPGGGQVYYPFVYAVPAGGVTTGVETAFYRVVTVPITLYEMAFSGGAQTLIPRVVPFVPTPTGWAIFPPESLHVWYYQTLPHPPTSVDAETIPYLRTQYHSTKLEDFQNLSVVLQPPKNGLSGEAWLSGFANLNPWPIQVEHQAFFRECLVTN